MAESIILDDRDAVAIERVARNLLLVSEHAPQPPVIERAPTRDRVPKEQRPERTADKRRETLAMPRPGVDGSHQHEPLQSRILSLNTKSSDHDSNPSTARGAEQIEIPHAHGVHKLQHALGGSAEGTVDPLV